MRRRMLKALLLGAFFFLGSCETISLLEHVDATIEFVERDTRAWMRRELTSLGYSADFREAAGQLRLSAEAGDREAQHWLGELYFYGFGIQRDASARAKWHLEAAKSGHMMSQYFLGQIYLEGAGVEQSYPKALEWLRKSASGEFSPARKTITCLTPVPGKITAVGPGETIGDDAGQASFSPEAAVKDFNSGVAYWAGECNPEEDERGLVYIRRSANAGYVKAQYLMAVAYHVGRGVPADLKQASFWYAKAAKGGHAAALRAIHP